ncbi:serine/arginine repetitive matrix protein 2-like isoform X2 [Phlebotomus argentipes]|uniref:serine/arginine repetitive matrix protein 2-like isoform X2 n=1 Tax=Phlebotomus argentipes TaxID=94469 RepID=UPI002893658A|nr:serine/arginine repetitive matrix protein 2-like isoform X2 [Phlebotomus argentipes]
MNRKQKEVKKTVSSSKMSPATSKLPGRQTNNSLSSVTGNIIIPEIGSGSAKSAGSSVEKIPVEKARKKKAKSSQIFTETEEVLQIGMHKVLEYVKNHKDAWPFMDPVEEDIAPRYYSIIRRPMDLLKMEEKLDNGEYATFTEFRNDFKLIVNNCRLYNGQNNEYTEMVNNLQEAFEKATKKYFEQNSSDEEDANLEYPDLKTNVFREKYTAKPLAVKAGKKEVLKKSTTKRSKHSMDDPSEESDVSEEVVKEKKGKTMDKETVEKQKAKHKSQEVSKEPIESPRGTKRKRKEKDKDRKRRKKNDGKTDRRNESDEDEDSVEEPEKKVSQTKASKESAKKDKHTKSVSEKSPNPVKKEKIKSAKEKVHESVSKGKESPKKAESAKSVAKNAQKKGKSAAKDVTTSAKNDKVSKKKANDADETVSKDLSSDGSVLNYPAKKKASEKKADAKKTKEKGVRSKGKEKPKEEESRKNKHKTKPSLDSSAKVEKKKSANLSPISSERSSHVSQSAFKTNSTKQTGGKASAGRFHKDDDLMSISSRSFSRSPSPVSSTFSNVSDDFHNDHSKRKLPSRPPTPDIKDKFDLIKERRRAMVAEEKAAKSGRGTPSKGKSMKGGKASPGGKEGGGSSGKDSKDKHQTLNETIERLKQSTEKTKQRTAVIDEILGGKPTQEKTIFERLRDPNADPKASPQKSTGKKKDEYDFVDDTPSVSSHRTKKENQAKAGSGKKNSKSSKVIAEGGTPSKKNSKNMEALEQGVWEQTLKDINRWLEPPSDSNSPSRYIWDDFEAEDFRRPVPIQQSSARTQTPSDVPLISGAGQKDGSAAGSAPPGARMNPPSGQGPNAQAGQRKDIRDKRKTLKDKITVRKREVARPIDRLQPGKTKGNLIQNTNKPDELFPLGNLSKLKEIKNSLMVKPTETGPKLSLGTVLDTEEFGLVQQHNFVDEAKDVSAEKVSEKENAKEEKEKTEQCKDTAEKVKSEKCLKENEPDNQKDEKPAEKVTATPNLSAWFKAFGAPKKAKKTEEEELAKKKMDTSPSDVQSNDLATSKSPASLNGAESGTSYSQPAPRQRKASTGSTVSERSSYSQDPDSPRIAIDERMYPGPYPSPLGASPILTSPKPEELPKSASPYSLNGAIKVGFYQDTTTKSSPEKSCSPREQPSTYPQYSQHVYSSATSPAMTGLTSPSYGSYGNYSTTVSAADGKKSTSSKSPASYYDQYKQQRSEDSSDYNNSMSPNNNPNSPYQHQQLSPYQQQHSPYQQQQHSPFQAQQKVNSGPISPYQASAPQQQPSALSPQSQTPQYHARQQQQPQQPQKGAPVSPFSHSNHSSPYSQHDPNSPYSQPEQLSPFHQNPNSPKPSAQVTPEQSSTSGDWQAPSHIPPQFEAHNMMPPAAHGQPSLPSQCNQEKLPTAVPSHGAQLQHRGHLGAMTQAPPMAHHHQDMGQNMTPAHQNYPPYSSLQGKRYDESQNLFMPPSAQQVLRQQNIYDAPPESVQNPLNYRQNAQPAPSKHNELPAQQSDMINLGYSGQGKAMPEDAEKSAASKQQQQMFDLLAFSKYGKQLDISTSKAFEMFNRAASMGFPKSLPLATSGSTVPPSGTGKSPPDLFDLNYGKGITQSDYASQGGNNLRASQQKTITELGPMTGYQQQLKQHLGAEGKSAIPGAHQTANPQLQQASQQHAVPGAKGVDLAIPNPRQSQLLHDAAASAAGQKDSNVPRYETLQPPAYKTSHPYNAIDPSLRNLTPLPIMDEHLLSLQQSTAGGYYDKTIPSAHMFGKNMHHQSSAAASLQQMFTSGPISTMSPYHEMGGKAQPMPQPVQEAPAKSQKRGKKKKATAGQNASDLMAQNVMQQQQGFQSYAGLKTGTAASSGAATASTDSSAISLKSASMVPGSAFNFGPTPTGLSLPYGPENPPGYLEDFRNNPNPYYLPTGHRNTPDAAAAVAEKGAGNVPVSAPSYHQFLSHPTTRPSYPFMNSPQLDATSPIYQQYLHRATEAQMMLNQGLLAPPGAPGAYSQSSYHHALGMHKSPYDAMNTMNRAPWF